MNEIDNEEDHEQELRINVLLSEYDIHRASIKEMIEDLEKIRQRIDILIPDTLDARYIRFFEEKVKAITGLFSSLLDMRKEIAKSIKDEIDIRRKIKNAENQFDIDDLVDIRSMAFKIDEFKKDKEKHQKERMDKNKEQTIEEGIEIPGITKNMEGMINVK